MTHRDSQLYAYFCAAVQLRHGSDINMAEQSRAHLRALAQHCGNTTLARAAARHLELCGMSESNWQKGTA